MGTVTSPNESIASRGASWHALEINAVAETLDTDLRKGLTESQALRRPAADRIKEVPIWRLAFALFARQWKGSVVLILCVSSFVFWLLGQQNDALGIILPVFFAVTLGFLTDFRSQRELAALQSLNAPTATVIRGGLMIDVPADRVVRGDLLVLRGGSIVPADGRLTQAGELSIQESSLTGESDAVFKRCEALPAETPLAERVNMAYAGTVVLTGSGRMLVTATGFDTELGRIGRMVHAYVKEETPLEAQVESLGRRLGALILLLSAAITGLGLLFGQTSKEMLKTGFLLAIAAIPEGLPAVNTVALAWGLRSMVRARAMVRRLSAVETLGSVDVVCVDKTGTLTENIMRAAVVRLPGRRLEVSGSGYAPNGRFFDGPTQVDPAGEEDLQRLLRIGVLCNNATLESHEGWHVHGSPTEGALLTLAAEGEVDLEEIRRTHPRMREVPFTSSRKFMTVIVRTPSGRAMAAVKGAVGSVLRLCDRLHGSDGGGTVSDAEQAAILREAERLGSQGLRVLGLAYRDIDPSGNGDAESGLIWAGMVGLLDPPRKTAAETVGHLSRAGIKTIIVTGDQSQTAAAVAARLGLPHGAGRVCDAEELSEILRRRAWEELERITVLARVSPEQKLRLVEALKNRGHVVSMTGDGINDAPALKAADIGVAMGAKAADVAKEASDLVLTDAEFTTLTTALEEGRRIYANIQRSARYLLLCSLSNLGLMTAGIVLRLPLAMTALQILWLNMVFHIFPGIALAVAPNPRRFLEEPPRSRDAALLGWRDISALALESVLIWGCSLVIFTMHLAAGVETARSLALASLGLTLLGQTFVALADGQGPGAGLRSAGASVWAALTAGMAVLAFIFYFAPLRALLATVPLTPRQWASPAAAALSCMAAISLGERFKNSWRNFRAPLLGMTVFLVLQGPAGAIFTKTQMDRIDTEPLFDSEYFMNLLSFSYPMRWQELWKSTGSAYRINAASLDCCDLLLQQELRFERRLVDGLTFRYELTQQDDKDLQDFHQWVEFEQKLGLGVSGLVFGEPTFQKEDSDIGFGLGFRRNAWKASVRHYFVDFNFNDRGRTSRQFGVKPDTDRFSIENGSDAQTLSAYLEIDYPLRLDVPDQNLQFHYRRTTAEAQWRRKLSGGWNRRFSYDYQFQDKGGRFNPDPTAQSIDTRRQLHQALLEFDGPIGRKDKLEAGQSFLERVVRTDDANAPNSGIFYRRWEVQPYARWRRSVVQWLEAELAAFLSFGENRKRYSGNPAASDYSNLVQAKCGTGADFVFGSAGRIGIYATWDVDNPSHPWGGGNVRAAFFL